MGIKLKVGRDIVRELEKAGRMALDQQVLEIGFSSPKPMLEGLISYHRNQTVRLMLRPAWPGTAPEARTPGVFTWSILLRTGMKATIPIFWSATRMTMA